VLGLASLVGAFPYTVPDWMPAIVVELATHISDAVPVKGTVKKAMGEFWRTHQDMWPIFKLMFNEQQLHTLTEMLASPTYYS
jgi:proteasome activator subunit 4